MKKNSSHKTLSIVKRISITNIGIFIIACILSIVATLKLNVEYHIDRDAQMMKVYISNTLSSIDNTLKDMGRVSLIAFSDQTVQDILKGTDYSFDEKMENEEYLKKLYSSMISIRDDVRGIYIFNNEDMVFYSDTWNPFLGFDWNVVWTTRINVKSMSSGGHDRPLRSPGRDQDPPSWRGEVHKRDIPGR